jgi:hypothetical protein
MLDREAIANLRSRLSMHLDELEETANTLSDADHEWWPFVVLRPRPEQPLSSLRVCLLALLYGAPFSLAFLLVDPAVRHHATRTTQLAFVAWVCVAIFAVYRVTFAYFWNRRAERLARNAKRES